MWLHSECKMQGKDVATNEVQNIEMLNVGKGGKTTTNEWKTTTIKWRMAGQCIVGTRCEDVVQHRNFMQDAVRYGLGA